MAPESTAIPIIFSDAMVRALLEGRKTQTRRLASSPLSKARPGDRLWVREAWCPANSDDGPVLLLRANKGRRYLNRESYPVDYSRFPAGGRAWLAWAADVEAGHVRDWRPSIHMPRWASRLTLRITTVRRQFLQEISGVDAEAEGYEPRGADPCVPRGVNACLWYSGLWDDLHGAGSWRSNPEIVAITFEVIRANVDTFPAEAAMEAIHA